MQTQHLFEYAVIRVVPRVEREEFINVGVILYCARLKFLKAVYLLDASRLRAFAPTIDLDEIAQHLCSFERICAGNADAGPIGMLDIASRFRWLSATRSTVVQCSKVHPGFCKDPDVTLFRLFSQMVG